MVPEEHSLHAISYTLPKRELRGDRVNPRDNSLTILAYGNVYDEGIYDDVVMHPVWKKLPSKLQLHVLDELCYIAEDQCSWLEEEDQYRDSELG